MSLISQWMDSTQQYKTQEEQNKFWRAYLEQEKEVYEQILRDKENNIEGILKDVATKFNMDPITFAGFLDGINTSLVEQIDLDELSEDSFIKMNIDFRKLYFNMLDAKADWLYSLPEWDDILSVDERKQITKEYRTSKMAVSSKIGRNEPCPCGSGLKYKKCCGR